MRACLVTVHVWGAPWTKKSGKIFGFVNFKVLASTIVHIWQRMVQVCSPQVQSHTFHCTLIPGSCKVVHSTAPSSRAQRPLTVRIGNMLLPVEESTKFLGLRWDSHLSFKKHSVLRHSARRLSTSSKWLLIWSREETEIYLWCCTGPLFAQSWIAVTLCLAQHQTLIYNNWTAYITLDWLDQIELDLSNDATRPSGYISKWVSELLSFSK